MCTALYQPPQSKSRGRGSSHSSRGLRLHPRGWYGAGLLLLASLRSSPFSSCLSENCSSVNVPSEAQRGAVFCLPRVGLTCGKLRVRQKRRDRTPPLGTLNCSSEAMAAPTYNPNTPGWGGRRIGISRSSPTAHEVQGRPGLYKTTSHLSGFIWSYHDACLGPALLILQYCERASLLCD